MIQTISNKKTATYNESGTQLDNLKKINFIYGANGSGKTTLSNFIADSTDNRYSYCGITWQHSQPLDTLVYNKEFIDRNFGKASIEGVFTLGQATDDDIKNINKKQDELEEIKKLVSQKKDAFEKQTKQLENEKENFTKECWEKVYKKHENNFKEAFKGSMQKETFKDKLLVQFDTNSSELFSFNELNEKSKTIFGKVPENISLINGITFDKLSVIEENEIWATKIIGKADVNIAKMIQKLNLNDWVNQGKSYLQDDSICPFCQQLTITDDFKKQLEDYFDKSFLNSTNQTKIKSDEYLLLNQNLINDSTFAPKSQQFLSSAS